MKKLTSIFMASLLALAIAACGSKNKKEETTPPPPAAEPAEGEPPEGGAPVDESSEDNPCGAGANPCGM